MCCPHCGKGEVEWIDSAVHARWQCFVCGWWWKTAGDLQDVYSAIGEPPPQGDDDVPLPR